MLKGANFETDNELYYKEESYKIIGAAMEVHNELKNGFLEGVYHEALGIELKNHGIPFISQPAIEVYYKDQLLEKTYIPDFVCFDNIIVELKSVECLKKEHYTQVFNYLKATSSKLGILINFGSTSLEYKRIVK